ncbi:extracellular mutant protein 11-domain-containing protein [Phyllosticta citriasiana]|uniref:Extracellular mutant protein 11-domain-containing protein n=1 Tax=Phyllosticta citriasiana TaxID=595635 RepID=A0ABR1KXZ4_9PEZI
MKNFINRQNRSTSPVKDDGHAAKASGPKPRERVRDPEALKMPLQPTKLSHDEAGDEDNHSLGGDSSIVAETLKEKTYHRQLEHDNFATDDENADMTTMGSVGFDNYLTSAMPSQHGHLESQERNSYDDEQSQDNSEDIFPGSPNFISRYQNGINMMNDAWNNSPGSFPPTTNGELSEPEAEEDVADSHGQRVEPHYQAKPQVQSQFMAKLAQRSAPSTQPLSYRHEPAKDLFQSIRQQASSPQRSFRPGNLAHFRTTETGSPRPHSARPKSQTMPLHNHINVSSHAQQSVPNGKPSTISQPQGPSPPESIVQGIQANSHKTISTPDEQSLGTSNDSVLPLDYDEDQLHTMSYSQLAHESFDHNPRSDASRIPLRDSTLPLAERLAQLQHGHSADAQAAFFASLTIDEYDEAGAWFAQQLGAIISKVAQARREKRRVAQQFEDEIRQRHERVTQKKRRLDDEIAKMRGKGQDLLPKTPGKSRAGSAMR